MPQDKQQKQGQFAAKVEQSLGIINGTKLWSPFPFSGLNQQDSPPAIDDKEFSFIENFFRLGNGYLRTAWDSGAAFYSAPAGLTILPYFFWYNIGAIDYLAVFLSDGTAVQIRQSDRAQTVISSVPNTFYQAGGSLPICSQSGTQYLLIGNHNTQNDYWIWDGALLYESGTVTPTVTITANGRRYSSPPAVTAYGGSGSGTAFSATVDAGGVIDVTVTNPGHGYQVGDTVLLQFVGGGSDTSAILMPVISNGSITSLSITSPGSGYSTASVAFTGGGGTGAAATAVIGTGAVTSVVVSNPGTDYTNATVAFSGGGATTQATGTVSLTGIVNAATVGAGGSGYGSAPTVAFVGGGASVAATGHAVLTGAAVTSVVIDTGGSGYTSAPTVTLSGGGGSGATATATITGTVAAINITDGGDGYTSSPTVTISGDGTGAAATATAAGQGTIAAITITNPGTDYTASPTVTITGDGTGATASAYISSGHIQSVTVVDGGTNYITAPLLDVVGGNGAGATLIAQLTPTTVSYVNVTSGGQGYFRQPTVRFESNGIGGGARAAAVVEGGVVVQIKVTDAGQGYVTAPTIFIAPDTDDLNNKSGYTVGGAAATAVLTATSIGSVIVEAPGQGYTQTPGIIVEAGANDAASATVQLMPFGLSGNSIETFNSRVWLSYPFQKTTTPTGGDFSVTAGGSLTDTATSDGGLFFTNTDRFLRKQYTGIRQSNGYLYFLADSSISVVSNVQTAGDPPTTTFTYQNVDPQIGMAWRDSCQDFGRTIVFANATGVYGLYGGAATKISSKLDQLFANAILPPDPRAVTPCSAVATIFNVKHYFLLLTILDTNSFAPTNVMLAWNEKEWTIVSQTPVLIYIGTQEVNSECVAWGTDGASIYPLFNQASATLQKRIVTKTYGTDSLLLFKDFLGIYLQSQDVSIGQSGIDIDVSAFVSGMAIQPEQSNIDNQSVPSVIHQRSSYTELLLKYPDYAATFPFWPVYGSGTGGFSFSSLAIQMATTSPDFVLSNILIAYLDNTAYQ